VRELSLSRWSVLHLRQKDQLSCTRCIAAFSALLLLTVISALPVVAQEGGVPPQLDLGIIVMPTQVGAEAVLKQLNSGADFSVLAKEKSTDATAVDGGYGAIKDSARMERKRVFGRTRSHPL